MKLRLRLALTAVAVMLPMVLALLGFDAAAQRHAEEPRLTRFALNSMSSARERCEASPATWGGEQVGEHGPRSPPHPPGYGPPPPGPPPPGPPPDGFSPDDAPPPGPPPDGSPGRVRLGGDPPSPPARPAVLFAYGADLTSQNPAAPPIPPALAAAIQGQDVAVAPGGWAGSTVEILVRMPWTTGPCAVVLARGSTDSRRGRILPETELWVVPMIGVLGAMILAMGPVVRRLRLLTEAVRRSAGDAYGSSVAVAGGDEIGELARAFDAAAREIRSQLLDKERREQALRDFLGNTTHDVMIPLTVLLGHLTALREEAAGQGAIDVAVLVAAMDEAHYMASLVHNLAIAARLDAAEPTLQPSAIDLEALVLRVAGRHRPIARERGVALETAVPAAPVHAAADVTLLEQALSNVTYNAIRYNREGGHVAVILERPSPDRFSLRVLDDGPGIPTSQLAALIARGARGDEARTRAPEGRGLGLYIAYRAAELHGFRLTLRPSEDGGLEVEIEGRVASL